jgi:hypothetical protein
MILLRPLVDIGEENSGSGGAGRGNCADGKAVGSWQCSVGSFQPETGGLIGVMMNAEFRTQNSETPKNRSTSLALKTPSRKGKMMNAERKMSGGLRIRIWIYRITELPKHGNTEPLNH